MRSTGEVLWLFVLALVVRGVAAWANPAILPDSVSLLRGADRLRGEGLGAVSSLREHPLLPWLVSHLPADLDAETAATAICVLAGAIAVWPLHVIARRACGRHAATAAGILYAALPKAVGVASVPLASALLLPLFLSGLSLACVASLPSSSLRRWLRLAGAGALCGLAYLCRPEGLIAAGGAAIAASALAQRGRKLVAGGVVALAFVAVAAPYVTHLSEGADRVVVTPKKDLSRFVGLAPAPAESASRPAGEEEPSVVRESASAIEGALTAPLFVLALAGAFLPTRWRRRGAAGARGALLVTAAAFVAALLRLRSGWDYGGARHVLAGCLLLLPFAGEGFVFVGVFITRAVARRRLAVVLASFVAIPMAVKTILRPEGESMADARALGELLGEMQRARSREELVVASFKEPVVAWYAERTLGPAARARDLPLWGRFRQPSRAAERPGAADALRAELAATLRREGARWLVIDLFEEPDERDPLPSGRELADALVDDGVLATPCVAAGSSLAAFAVRRE